MNEYDSNRVYDLVKKIDYEKTDVITNVDCYILNTCHIREKATEKVYHDVGRLKKEFRNKKKPIVIIIGCVAQAEGEILLNENKYIDAVVGPQSYHLLNDTIARIEKKRERINYTNFEVIEKFDSLNTIKNSNNQISSFLTIQEGCNKFCKFCVVPYTRGQEYSRSIDELTVEAKNLVKNGVKEITLLGQNVNAYSFKKNRLSHLINEISKIKDLKRIRYTTSHPIDFTEDLIQSHKNEKKLMPIVHLPVQSGSNDILREMNRKHTIEDYIELVKKLKTVNPLIKFSSDFIIGYPGEKNEDFENTLKLVKEIEYINTFSFIYSPRPGTPAANLNGINENEAKKRLIVFQKLAEKIKMKYRRSLFNKISLVLFENKMNNKNVFFGRDEYLNSVVVKSHENLKGKIKKVKILDGNQNTLYGEVSKKLIEENFAA